MPRVARFVPRAYHNAKKPHLQFVVVVPPELIKVEGRQKAFFERQTVAKAFSERMARDLERHRSLAFQLTESERLEAAECLAKLTPRGRTMREATEFFLAHLDATERSAPIERLVEEVIAAKVADGFTKDYIAPLRSRLGKFAAAHPGMMASAFTTPGIEEWLGGNVPDPTTRNNYRRELRSAFAMAHKRRYVVENPVAGVAKAKQGGEEVESLTVAEVRALLAACDEIVLPLVAIGAFAGIRPKEIARLRWAYVDFTHGEINVPASRAKTASRRLVRMSDNLRAWLHPYLGRTGPLLDRDMRTRFEKARARAELTRWPHDAMRHTYASHHLAHWNDAPALALQMGHTDTELIFSSYRRVVTEREAREYWAILPEGKTGFGKQPADAHASSP